MGRAFASSPVSSWRYLGDASIASKMRVQGARIGGISGAVWDPGWQRLIAVSDDRGRYGEPRLVVFKVDWSEDTGLKVEVDRVIFLRPSQGKNHVKAPRGRWPTREVLDLEGIALTPWNTWVLSSEGDQGRMPRVPPRLLEVEKSGEWIRDLDIPSEYIPETQGKHRSGVRGNRAFEGLSASVEGKTLLAATEAPLLQDQLTDQLEDQLQDHGTGPSAGEGSSKAKLELIKPTNALDKTAKTVGSQSGHRMARVLRYEMKQAFVYEPSFEWFYPLVPTICRDCWANVELGLTELLQQNDVSWLFLQRQVDVGISGIHYSARLQSARLVAGTEQSSFDGDKSAAKVDLVKPATSELESARAPRLSKVQVQREILKPQFEFDMADFVPLWRAQKKIGNFEALAWIPIGKSMPDGGSTKVVRGDRSKQKRGLLLITDNNFESSPTHFVLLQELGDSP